VQILLYASPGAYSVSAVPANLRVFYYVNPLTAPLEGLRASLLGGAMPGWGGIMWTAATAAGLSVVGMMSFKRMERRFADVI
jgi:lipopolysaccharide transport system permease protein